MSGSYRSFNQRESSAGPDSSQMLSLNEHRENEIFIKDEHGDISHDDSNFILSDHTSMYSNTNNGDEVDENPLSPLTSTPADYMSKNSSMPTEKFTSKNLILLYCQYCNRTFKKQHNVKQTECEHCDRALQYQCANCDKRYNHQRSAITHVKLECRNRLGFGCVLCDFRTNHRKGLVAHIENAHAAYDPNKAVTCDRCRKIYKNYKNLRKHLIDCGKMPNLQCDHCHYKSNHKSRIRDHIKCRHMLDSQEFHKCSRCGKRYKTASYFRKHEAYLCKMLPSVA